MQFSIFSVPFKCTKEMFNRDKLVRSACIVWAMVWRYAVIEAALNLVFLYIHKLFFSGGDVSWTVANMPYILYINQLILMILSGFVANYLVYYALFRKQYQSFDRVFINQQATPAFFSLVFWKTNFLVVGLISLLIWMPSFLINWGLFLLYQNSSLEEMPVFLYTWMPTIKLLFSMLLLHMTIHGGSWGVELRLKESSTRGEENQQ